MRESFVACDDKFSWQTCLRALSLLSFRADHDSPCVGVVCAVPTMSGHSLLCRISSGEPGTLQSIDAQVSREEYLA